jgi:anti-sigma B factor antagonist
MTAPQVPQLSSSGERLASGRCFVSVDRAGVESWLRVEGPFDANTLRDISPAIEGLLVEGPTRVMVDLEHVTMLDSAGVGALVSLWKRMKAQGGDVVAVGAHDQPLAVLKLLKLDVVFCA